MSTGLPMHRNKKENNADVAIMLLVSDSLIWILLWVSEMNKLTPNDTEWDVSIKNKIKHLES